MPGTRRSVSKKKIGRLRAFWRSLFLKSAGQELARRNNRPYEGFGDSFFDEEDDR